MSINRSSAVKLGCPSEESKPDLEKFENEKEYLLNEINYYQEEINHLSFGERKITLEDEDIKREYENKIIEYEKKLKIVESKIEQEKNIPPIDGGLQDADDGEPSIASGGLSDNQTVNTLNSQIGFKPRLRNPQSLEYQYTNHIINETITEIDNWDFGFRDIPNLSNPLARMNVNEQARRFGLFNNLRNINWDNTFKGYKT